jgi:UPF0176 protein
MDRSTSLPPFKVAALYRFCPIADTAALRTDLAAFCCGQGIMGTLLVAREGINGTVAGSDDAIDALVARLESLGVGAPEIKFSRASQMPFRRLKVKLKAEIVTMGQPDIDPAHSGTYVEPGDWNALIADPDTIVIDTRNTYEVAIGTFRGAVDPATETFREFPGWAQANRASLEGRKVAMFCTGGIRCEKATAYVRSLGVGDVYHLRGGILKYLKDVPAQDSLWEGECFVFDERVSVGHGLAEGEAELCRACRRPLTAARRASSAYRPGISCPQCVDEFSDDDRARFAERQRQVDLAERRGDVHIGRKA